jgi:TPR repeat protein
MYATGDGIPQDRVEALKWYDIAAEMGLDPYIAERDALAATMDRAMIAEAARRTRSWLAAHRRWDDESIAATAATGKD